MPTGADGGFLHQGLVRPLVLSSYVPSAVDIIHNHLENSLSTNCFDSKYIDRGGEERKNSPHSN